MSDAIPAPPGTWAWFESQGVYSLITPTGHEAATVHSQTAAWQVWGLGGVRGPNDVGRGDTSEARLEHALWCAIQAAKVLWYESGWVDPLKHLPHDESDDNDGGSYDPSRLH